MTNENCLVQIILFTNETGIRENFTEAEVFFKEGILKDFTKFTGKRTAP